MAHGYRYGAAAGHPHSPRGARASAAVAPAPTGLWLASKLRIQRQRLMPVLVLMLMLAVVLALPAQAQIVPPSSLVGRYELTMQTSSATSPIQNGVGVILELSADGALCIDNFTLTNAVVRDGSYVWSSADMGLEFVASAGNVGSFAVGANGGAQFGQLVGTRVADYAVACGRTAYAASAEDLFSFAESTYPDLFPASPLVFTQDDGSLLFRFYPASGIFLSVAGNGLVQVRGGAFGSTARSIGTVEAIWTDPDAHDFRDYLVNAQATDILGGYYVGTYTLTLEAEPFSPVPTGTTLTFVVNEQLELCVGEAILAPQLSPPNAPQGIPVELGSNDIPLYWSNPLGGHYYVLHLVAPENKPGGAGTGAFELMSSTGFRYGTFSGVRSSLSAECRDAAAPPNLDQINLVLGLLEQHYPTVFPGGPQTYSQRINGNVYRGYHQTGVTLRVVNEQVFAKGGVFGGSEVKLGKVAPLISALRERSLSYAIPASLAGTYEVGFAASGPHVGIPDEDNLSLALYQDGRLCLNGLMLLQPIVDPLQPNVVRWDSAPGGFSLQLATDALVENELNLSMVSKAGLLLGELSGSKTLALPTCDGQLEIGVDYAELDRMFDLAEQRFPQYFPVSTLTYTQLEDSALQRYYPSTGILVSVSSTGVKVSGGAFGSGGRELGSVGEVTTLLLGSTGGGGNGGGNGGELVYTLSVSGTVDTSIAGGMPIPKTIEITQDDVELPVDLTPAALIPHVQFALGDELHGNSTYAIGNIVTQDGTLSFDVVISNEVKMVIGKATRSYALSFVYGVVDTP